MTQDGRRETLQEQSRHIKIGMNYLPAVARPNTALFNDLTAELRALPEWAFVDGEVEIRLILTD